MVAWEMEVTFERVSEGLKVGLGCVLVWGRGQGGHVGVWTERTAKGAIVRIAPFAYLSSPFYIPAVRITRRQICNPCLRLTVCFRELTEP